MARHRSETHPRGVPLQTATSIPQTSASLGLAVGRPRRSLLTATLVLAICSSLPAQDFSDPPKSQAAPSAALVQQANDALAAGDLPAALKLLTALNVQTPKNPQVLYNLGQTTEALNDGPQAATVPQPLTSPETWYRQAIAANPLFPAPYVALGLLLARTHHLAEAHVLLAAVPTLGDADPSLKARAWRALARLDESTAPATASEELLSALKLTPETPDDILLSAEIAESARDLPGAEQAYRRYLNGTPGDTAAIASLAHVLLAEHHPADAEVLLSSARTAHPDDPTLTSQLAAAYVASGDPAKIAQAAPLLEALHIARPDDSTVARLLARIYLETGQPEKADPLYAALIAASGPKVDPTLLDSRAEALLRLHQPGAAEALLKQAVADPAAFPTPGAFGDAAIHLAFAASEIDDPRQTLQALTLRATVLPPSPTALFLEATANDTLHQSHKAVDLYKQFLAAANGDFPEEVKQARQRLAILDHRK